MSIAQQSFSFSESLDIMDIPIGKGGEDGYNDLVDYVMDIDEEVGLWMADYAWFQSDSFVWTNDFMGFSKWEEVPFERSRLENILWQLIGMGVNDNPFDEGEK